MARILFCTWQYHPVRAGGAEQQARLQAEELVRRGHDVVVLCPSAPGVAPGAINGVAVVRLRRARGQRLGRFTYLLHLAGWVFLRGPRFEIVHVHMANLQADVVVLASRMRRVRVHVKVANSGIHGETRRLAQVAKLTRWYGLRHADAIQALSEESATEVERIGVSLDRVVRIPNGVRLPTLPRERHAAKRALGLHEETGVVLYAGRFARYKGLADLLEAWRIVRTQGWQLVLVGENASDDPFGEIPDQRGVLVRPWASSVQQYLDAADVFVLPSHSEGMSNALLEAMASGLAVVSSDTGAAREMIEDGRSGLIHATGAVDELAACLQRVISDDELRALLAAGARERAKAFSVESVVDQLEAVYQRLLRAQV